MDNGDTFIIIKDDRGRKMIGSLFVTFHFKMNLSYCFRRFRSNLVNRITLILIFFL